MSTFQPLDARERAVLDGLLRVDLPDADALRQQAATARGRRSCECGCPTIAFEVAPDAPRARADHRPWPVEGTSADGRLEVLLFVADGWLSEMELVTYDGDPPSEWPDAHRFAFRTLR